MKRNRHLITVMRIMDQQEANQFSHLQEEEDLHRMDNQVLNRVRLHSKLSNSKLKSRDRISWMD